MLCEGQTLSDTCEVLAQTALEHSCAAMLRHLQGINVDSYLITLHTRSAVNAMVTSKRINYACSAKSNWLYAHLICSNLQRVHEAYKDSDSYFYLGK